MYCVCVCESSSVHSQYSKDTRLNDATRLYFTLINLSSGATRLAASRVCHATLSRFRSMCFFFVKLRHLACVAPCDEGFVTVFFVVSCRCLQVVLFEWLSKREAECAWRATLLFIARGFALPHVPHAHTLMQTECSSEFNINGLLLLMLLGGALRRFLALYTPSRCVCVSR